MFKERKEKRQNFLWHNDYFSSNYMFIIEKCLKAIIDEVLR